jgi:hypothetical protein
MHTQSIDSYQPISLHSSNKTWITFWLVILSLGVMLLLSYPVMRLGYYYQINYNEGWNVYHDREAINGHTLYGNPATNPIAPVNYPPLSFYIVGLAGFISGNYLIAGRILSLGSLFLFSLAGVLILRFSDIRWIPAVFSGLAMLALFSTYAQEYVGMNDPQMLAHAITVAGLLIYILRGKTISGLAATALILNMGLFTKHNILPVTIAVTLDILFRSRNRFFLWLGFFTLSFIVIDALFAFQSGGFFLDQILIGRGYNTDRTISQLNKLDIPFLLTALTAGWTALTLLSESKLRIFSFYLAISALAGLYFSGGSGTNINMFFDLFIAIGFLLGIALHHLQMFTVQYPAIHKVGFWLLPPLVVAVLLFHIPDRLPKSNSHHLLQLFQDNFLQDAAYLKSTPGQAFCENLLLCFTADKQLIMDPFLASEMAITGVLDENLILQIFETRQFSMVQLNKQLTDEQLKANKYSSIRRYGFTTSNMRIAIGKYYEMDRKVSSGVFYKARQ